VTDIVSFGSDRPPWRPSRRLILTAVVVLSVAAGGAAVVALADGGGPAAVAPTTPAPTGPLCPSVRVAPSPLTDGPAALAIDCTTRRGGGLDRRDPTAGKGPWTVVVRRTDGSLGRHGAVVTFPVAKPAPAGPGLLTWPLAGAYARIRGDLAESELAAIAADTTVVDGKPAVNPPAGFVVAFAGPYRPPAIHEIRYGSADLGERDALGGGLAVTAVARGGGFEDQLYATSAEDGGLVDGRPAVVTPAFGGNGALVWEPAPGVVAYVGYSGAMLNDDAVAALHRLAGRARPLSDREWRAANPQTVEQTNEPG
jgi:hypothetical protein